MSPCRELVAPDGAVATVGAMLKAVGQAGLVRHGLEFARLPAGGALAEAIGVAASRLGAPWHEVERWQRATLPLVGDDSCAEPGSFIEALWRGRRTLVTGVRALSRAGQIALSFASQLRRLKRRAVRLVAGGSGAPGMSEPELPRGDPDPA